MLTAGRAGPLQRPLHGGVAGPGSGAPLRGAPPSTIHRARDGVGTWHLQSGDKTISVKLFDVGWSKIFPRYWYKIIQTTLYYATGPFKKNIITEFNGTHLDKQCCYINSHFFDIDITTQQHRLEKSFET